MTALGSEAVPLPLRLHRDHLYVEAPVFEAHLAHVRSVALLRDGDDLLILPVITAEAGGFLIKQVNARGDRAIHAADFFRLNRIDENHRYDLAARRHEATGGFIIRNVFRPSAN